MTQKISSNDWFCDVCYDKSPLEITTKSKINTQLSPAICPDGRTVGGEKIVLDGCGSDSEFALWVHTNIGASVYQVLHFSHSIGDEEAA